MKLIDEKIIMATTKTKLKVVRIIFLISKTIRKFLGLPLQNIFIRRKGISWEVDLNEAIDLCLFIAGEYEPELIQAYKPIIEDKDFHIIDIGANIGAHTLNFANLTNKQAKVYAIEPTHFAVNKLKNNLAHNPSLQKKVSIHNVLLTNDSGDIGIQKISSSWDIAQDIQTGERNSFDGGFAQPTDNAIKMTLDQFIKENEITKVDLIKLDVDGNEVDILKGAQETFKRFRPILLVELSPIHFSNKEQPYSFSDQVQELIKLNYTFHDVLGKKITLNAEYLENWIPYGTLVNIIGMPN